MYFTPPTLLKLLKIDNDYAVMTAVDDSSYNFDFYYKIATEDAIKNDAYKVRVKVYTKSVPVQTPRTPTKGRSNPFEFLAGVLGDMINQSTSYMQEQENVICERMSDISAYINNNMIQAVQNSLIANAQAFFKQGFSLVSSNQLKQTNVNQPILHQTVGTLFGNDDALVQSSAVDTQSVINDMIFRLATDPSNIDNLTHRSVTAYDSVSGLTKKLTSPEVQNSPQQKLLNYVIFNPELDNPSKSTNDVSDLSMVQVLTQQSTSDVEVPVRISIPKSSLKIGNKSNTTVNVRFELLNNKSKLSIDTREFTLNISSHLSNFNVPLVPPTIKLTKSELSSKVNLEIKQVDPKAVSVLLYKKIINPNVQNSGNFYTLIGTYDLTAKQQSLLITVEKQLSVATVYRAIAVGPQNKVSSRYVNVIVPPRKYSPPKFISITTQIVPTGIAVEIRSIPANVSAVRVLSRNLTLHETQYSIVGNDVLPIINVQTDGYVDVIDADVMPGNVYEYVAELIYISGETHQSGCDVIEYVSLQEQKLDINIENLKITDTLNSNTQPNVTFTLNTKVLDSNIDAVNAMLHSAGIQDFFKDDVQLEREFLKSLLAHNIQRINLTTSEREDFGIITGTDFSDSALAPSHSVKPLVINNQYRYVITPFLRSPETMFNDFVKTKVDANTFKSYQFKPSKFLHPISLSRDGTIPALTAPVSTVAAGTLLNHSKPEIAFGDVGVRKTLDVSLKTNISVVKDAIATQLNRYLNVVTWNISGELRDIDCFVIMKQMNNVRTIIGTAHAEFDDGACRFLHSLTKRDVGQMSYVIVPIFNDYKVGASTYTNIVTIS